MPKVRTKPLSLNSDINTILENPISIPAFMFDCCTKHRDEICMLQSMSNI